MDRKAWIVITLCLIGMGINGWWMATHQPPPAPKPVATESKAASPAATTPAISPAAPDAKPAASAVTAPATEPEQKVELKNNAAAYTFTTKGGGIASAVMLDAKDHDILNANGKAAMGALSKEAKTWEDWDYKVVSQTEKGIAFEAETAEHLVIRKEYSFIEGEGGNPHMLNFKIGFTNKSGAKLSRDSLFLYTGAASSLRPDEIVKPGFCWNNAGDAEYKDTGFFGSSWFGSDVTELQKSFDRMRWAGVMSRFYAQLITTKDDQAGKIWSTPFLLDHSKDQFKDVTGATKDFAIHGGVSLPALEIGAGETKSFDLRIYLGPKIFHDLKHIDAVDPDRQTRYVMFYGWFSWVSRFLVYWLRNFHDWVFQSWGMAIILLTIFVRTLLWPVQAKANTTMKRMGLLSPKLKELQAKYKDNPQKQQQEMMKLYKEYGVNPLGGCLPMMVQIPIFFGFYRALQYAAELRGQSFAWVQDLSLPDTVTHFAGFAINPLPLVMVLTNFLQMKLTPQPQSVDKGQQRIMMFMPLIFLFICYSFASALALYWTTQNIYSILQAQIQRRFGKDVVLAKRPPPEGGLAAGSSPLAPRSPFGSQPKKKDKPGPPRLGGGGTRSTRKDS